MSDWAHRIERVVGMRDTDCVGHVNNAATISYLEDARTLYVFGRRGLTKAEEFDFILARTEIDYRSPAFLHERLEVLVRPTRIGTKSFELEYLVRELATGRVIAEARSVQVAYDFARRVSIEIPASLRALLAESASA
ncbi:MAG TPA: thioesterase family protein [Planctomycetota bacterium]|nr:thioesterase family protein [Planctomycetota bacterium]